MKKKIFGLILCVLLFLIFGITLYAFFDTTSVSDKEKRTLTSRPALSNKSWFSKEYSTKMDTFISDHVFKRDNLVIYAKSFESSLKSRMDIEYAADSKSKRQDFGSDALILQDRILMLYANDAPTKKAYIKAVETLYELVPANVNRYYFIAPSRIEFEKDEYKKYSDNQKEDIQRIYDLLPKNIKTIDVYSPLVGKDVNKLFFRTDHHWTHLGAYYAANAILTATKHDVNNINHFQQKRGANYHGFLCAKYNKISAFAAYPDELVYYVTDHIPNETVYYTDEKGTSHVKETKLIDPSRAGYYTFVEKIFEYAIINGKNKQGGCLVLVTDSFGYALVTWLAEKYDKIIIIAYAHMSEEELKTFKPTVALVDENNALVEVRDYI